MGTRDDGATSSRTVGTAIDAAAEEEVEVDVNNRIFIIITTLLVIQPD